MVNKILFFRSLFWPIMFLTPCSVCRYFLVVPCMCVSICLPLSSAAALPRRCGPQFILSLMPPFFLSLCFSCHYYYYYYYCCLWHCSLFVHYFSTGFSWQPCISTAMAAERLPEPVMVRPAMLFPTHGSAKVAALSVLSRRSHHTVSSLSVPKNIYVSYGSWANHNVTEWSKQVSFPFPSVCISPHGVSESGIRHVATGSTREECSDVLCCTCSPFQILPADQQGRSRWPASCTPDTLQYRTLV